MRKDITRVEDQREAGVEDEGKATAGSGRGLPQPTGDRPGWALERASAANVSTGSTRAEARKITSSSLSLSATADGSPKLKRSNPRWPAAQVSNIWGPLFKTQNVTTR